METKETINQFLTFAMGKELYAIRVCNVREVLTVPKVTRIPRMPEYMKGVVNIRGSVVPILDLKQKFGMGDTQMTSDTAIIVVEIQFGGDGEILNLGIFADSVKKVVAIQTSEIEAPPKIGSRIDTSFIEGMGHADDDFIVILNIAEILTAEDFKAFESAQVSEVSS
jgi:purine-binding chemotaxis protein CheW